MPGKDKEGTLGLGDDTPGSRVAPSSRAAAQIFRIHRFGPFRLYPAERRLDRDGETVPLGGRALDILILLVGNAGKVVAKQELMHGSGREPASTKAACARRSQPSGRHWGTARTECVTSSTLPVRDTASSIP